MKTIEIVPYTKEWPSFFQKEALLLKKGLGEDFIDLHHIGSTSVPGLVAKPIIDMVMVVKKGLQIEARIQELGYKARGELNIPFRHYFTKKGNLVKFHLHTYEEENPEIHLNLVFRNFLQNSPAACQEYTDLKMNLLKQDLSHEKGNFKLTGYTLGKDSFIKKILEQAGFNDFCLRFCTHLAEWEAYHRLFKRHNCSLNQIDDKDPLLAEPGHFHFVFYKGVQITGVAHLEFLAGSKATVTFFAIDLPYQNQGIEERFKVLLEKWLDSKKHTLIL